MGEFRATNIQRILHISSIYTIHYMEFSKRFVFGGETHDFWEFQYCDKGEIEVMADRTYFSLHQGEIVFHKPNEYHNIWSNGAVSPNLMVVSFKCDDDIMNYFKGKILKLDRESANLLGSIFVEARNVFAPPFGDPYSTGIDFLPNHEKVSEQLFINMLEIFLLKLISHESVSEKPPVDQAPITSADTEALVEDVKDFLLFNQNNILFLEDVAKRFNVSKEWLGSVFKKYTGTSIINTFILFKIDEAKRLIRESNLNITQIAEKLGYSSVHFFSRQFKKFSGMTPSEYSRSIVD